MIIFDELIKEIERTGIWVESSRHDVDKNGNEHHFDNPTIYPFGFELYFCIYNSKQRRYMEDALLRAWYPFRGKVLLTLHEMTKMAGDMRRYVLAVAWKDDGADELGQLFIDTLSTELKEPYTSPILIEALKPSEHKEEETKLEEGNSDADSKDVISDVDVSDVAGVSEF